jgi:HlyD family secretion protein
MPRWVIVSALSVLAVAILVWWTLLRPETIPVRVVAVERGRVESTVTNTKAGTVKARFRARISPEVGGVVSQIARREGDLVEAGEVLIALDDSTQRSQLALAEQSLRAVEAAAREACIRRDRAQRELARVRSLAERQVVSEDLLDELESASAAALAACHRAQAEEGRARAQIEATRVELKKMVIRAPFSGVVAELAVELGEWVTPSPPLLLAPAVVDLIDPATLYVSAPMDEVDSAAIHEGQPAKVSVDSHPGAVFPGRVARVAPYVLDVEAQNRTVEIEVEIEDAGDARILPGTSADVEVVLEAHEPVLRVPAPALLEGGRVLVAGNGRLEERSVELGLRNWDYAEVRSGLEEGESVVLSLDRVEVRAGARVEPELVEYTP